jgi:hypothetical protein
MAFLICIFIALLIFLTFVWQDKSWDKKWPPIDDDEFLRRCPPETNHEIALKVRKIVSEQTGVDYHRIYPEQKFVDDLFCC